MRWFKPSRRRERIHRGEERGAPRPFSPIFFKSTEAHPDPICEHVHVCPALRVQSCPHRFGCCCCCCCYGSEKGGAGAQPPAASAHIRLAQSHINRSVNAKEQPIKAENLNVFLIALFLIHYCTVTVLPQHLAPHTDTYFFPKRGVL